jgi:outer membrane protein assembly factor BamD (BamD/ComL family)
MIPGPSSQSNWRGSAAGSTSSVIPVGAEVAAGPPPAIPPDLPPPTQSVSIVGVKPEPEKKKEGFQLSDVSPENLWKDLRIMTGHGPDEKVAAAAMLEGEKLFRAKKYAEAAAQFAIAVDRWPDTPMEETAMFLEGESEFFGDQYSKAHDTYGGLLKKYINTRYLDTVAAREFAIGRYWEQCYNAKPTWPVTPNLTDNSRPMFDTFGYAVQAYERIGTYDPTGPLADTAKMALGNANFRVNNFLAAAENYDKLIKDYPNSKYQMTAHILDLQTKMRIYQGAEYDDGPLKEAKKLAQQSLSQFGPKLGAEEHRTRQAFARIVEEQANREFQVAKYYERRSCYGAARFYYQCVMKDFPNTLKAKEAQEQFDKIRTLPDEPPHYFKWLTDFLESDRR